MNRIRSLRMEKGLSQKEFAGILKIAQNTLSTWENGKYQPDNRMLISMANYFCVSVDYLLGRTNIKDKPADDNADELKELLDNPEFKAIYEKLAALTPEAFEIARAQIELLLKSQGFQEKKEQ